MSISCWRRLPFDTKVFGFPVGEVFSHASVEDLSSCYHTFLENNIELLYWCPKDVSVVADAQKQTWFQGLYVGDKTTFRLSETAPHGGVDVDLPKGFEFREIPFGKPTMDLIDLAISSGVYSRFFRDPNMTPSQYRAMYSQWTENSTLRQISDTVVGVWDLVNQQYVAVITLKESKESQLVEVGMFATGSWEAPSSTDKALLVYAMKWAGERACGGLPINIDIPSSNISCRKLVQEAGFEELASVPVYHWWMPLSKSRKIPNSWPYLTGLEILHLTDLVNTRSLESNGRYTKYCQQWLEDKLGCKKALLTGSATSALDQAAILAGVGSGDEIIMPSYTFVSTANAFVLRGATPVFVDVKKDTLNIDEDQLEAAISPCTKAIVVVHYAGVPCDMDRIMEIANRHDLLVIEDAAQALLSMYKGRFAGTIGHIGCLSFHYTKNVIAGEGGALLLNDMKFVDRAHIIWEKGTNRFDFITGKVNKYCWVDIGSSYVPNELMSAFLMSQLQDAEEANARRIRICEAYTRLLMPLVDKGVIHIMSRSADVKINGHIFWVVFTSKEQKQKVKKSLVDCNIHLYEHYMPLHASPAGERYSRFCGDMINTNEAGEKLLRLPVWVGMTWQMVYRIVKEFMALCDPSITVDDTTVRNMFLPKE